MQTGRTPLLILALLGCGCKHLALVDSHPPPAACPEGEVIRVKAPPQKIVVEAPEWPLPTEEEKAEARPEAPERAPTEPERAPEREREPEPTALEAEQLEAESALGTAMAIGQIASLTRTIATTHSLATTHPGSSALGIGISWIKIPIPVPRLFAVQETPSVTVPLSEANVVPVGAMGAYPGMVNPYQPVRPDSERSREELIAAVANAIKAERAAEKAHERARESAPQATDSEERKELEAKLAAADEQIKRMSEALKALESKLSQSQ